MNLSQNFTESSGSLSLTTLKPNTLLKKTGYAGFVLLLVLLLLKYRHDLSLIQQGQEKQAAWEAMEQEAESLRELSKTQLRFSRGYDTLIGWKNSRYSWAGILLIIKDALPGEAQNIQLDRLRFDEEIVGLREKIPGERVTDFFPLRREVEISINGVIKTDRTQSRLLEFQRTLKQPQMGNVSVATVTLVHSGQLLNKDRQPTDLTRFSFLLNLAPHELKP
ncbi:hypothetical protein P0Y35_17130 [Kiritimatiellaeota bacterium B1221]|nr:hypothetical protein [Kiritimatiellaeota bacterium B1221]